MKGKKVDFFSFVWSCLSFWSIVNLQAYRNGGAPECVNSALQPVDSILPLRQATAVSVQDSWTWCQSTSACQACDQNHILQNVLTRNPAYSYDVDDVNF